MLGHLILGALALALIVWLATRRPAPGARDARIACPTCRSLLLPLRDATLGDDREPHSYEVLACGTCELAISAVHAVPSAWAYCPACMQRSLQIACARLPVTEGRPPRVRAQETCHLCGYEDTRVFVVPEPEPETSRQGRVIPFPGARRR